jgi:hypothetical protein
LVTIALWLLNSPLLAPFREFPAHPASNIEHPTTSLRDEFILLFPGLVIFVVASCKTGFNEHFCPGSA